MLYQSQTALVLILLSNAVAVARCDDAAPPSDPLAAQISGIDPAVITDDESKRLLPSMISRDVRARRDAANRRETRAWREIASREDWERFRDARIERLRESLGRFPPAPNELNVRVTKTIPGDGYRIENVVFESRPGLLVTANLYLPASDPRADDKKSPARSMPGILICHSHHSPKTQGELQDMGVTWARLGCTVLVMDQLGHGERRQHPFRSATDYSGEFRVGRQDYYFRYNAGVQLHLIGESLMGWMAWDLMRGVDLLLARPGVDRDRIILLGAVAGGGDPAAVTAALDSRIAAVVPFNFGGPQPETVIPLPENAEESFNYAGGGSWESTRNLRLSARDGFQPWTIVGSVAPRRLVYGHEFAWDRERDPVWTRLERIFGFYDVRGNLAAAHGRGKLSGQPPESTHCNNIGPEHRRGIYSAFQKWFDVPIPGEDANERRSADDLTCLTADAAKEMHSRPMHELAAEIAATQVLAARRRLAALDQVDRRNQLREDCSRLLGETSPRNPPKTVQHESQRLGEISIERVVLDVESGILVPLLLLNPPKKAGDDAAARGPVVIAFAQQGKAAFLTHRSEMLAALLNGGATVCLPDLRGTGETRPDGDSRGRSSASTSISSSELMLGQTLVGSRLRDLRSVIRFLRSRPVLQHARTALWGDSFAATNPPDRRLDVPLDATDLPRQSEPLGGLVALLGALFDDVHAIYGRGGLDSLPSLLDRPFFYFPHDALVPGAVAAGDLSDLAASIAPRPLRLDDLVNGANQPVSFDTLARTYEPAREAYRSSGFSEGFKISERTAPDDSPARWLLAALRRVL